MFIAFKTRRSAKFGGLWLVFVVFGACEFPAIERANIILDANTDTLAGDALILTADAALVQDSAVVKFCYGTAMVKVCLATAPSGSFTVATAINLNTDTGPQCVATLSGGDNYCVVAAADININAALSATGTKSLVLLATDSITSSSVSLIDVSSHRGGTEFLGAGHDPTDCQNMTGTPPVNGGGGAGGSFAGLGGAGGTGVGAGGTAGPFITSPVKLRGGCPGQDGQGTTGSGGHGGGAVFLIAGSSITINSEVTAGGEGGEGGVGNQAAHNGGGGGGAGGVIGFDAPTVMTTNALIANGGGGGEGGSGVNQGAGGADGADAMGTSAAPGGNANTTSGGNGGDGGSSQPSGSGGAGQSGTQATGAGAGIGGGGGGGGGTGFIIHP